MEIREDTDPTKDIHPQNLRDLGGLWLRSRAHTEGHHENQLKAAHPVSDEDMIEAIIPNTVSYLKKIPFCC